MLVYLITAFVPSLTACLVSTPGRMRWTDVCIFSAGSGISLVVVFYSRRLCGYRFKYVVYETVYYGQSLTWNASVWMQLLQNVVVNVHTILFPSHFLLARPIHRPCAPSSLFRGIKLYWMKCYLAEAFIAVGWIEMSIGADVMENTAYIKPTLHYSTVWLVLTFIYI